MTCATSHINFIVPHISIHLLICQFLYINLRSILDYGTRSTLLSRGGGGGVSRLLETHGLHCYPEEQTSFINTIILLISTNSKYRKITGSNKCSYSIIISFVKKYWYMVLQICSDFHPVTQK